MSEGLSFFARRRAGLRAEAEQAAARDAEALEPSAVEVLDEEQLDLPDPDTMVAGDDFTVFMAKTVSRELRNRALRQLWRSNPVLACVDGLNDYDEDYRAMAAGQGPLKTTYEVGRGLKRHIDYINREILQDEAPACEPDEALPPAPAPVAYAEPVVERDAEVEESEAALPAPRRMRFQTPQEVS